MVEFEVTPGARRRTRVYIAGPIKLGNRATKELGDVLWYLAHACNVMGWSLAEIASGNVAKLLKRYPNGFTTEDSIARRDEVTP